MENQPHSVLQEPVKTQLWLNKFQDVSWPTSGNMTMRPRLPFTFEAAHQVGSCTGASPAEGLWPQHLLCLFGL